MVRQHYFPSVDKKEKFVSISLRELISIAYKEGVRTPSNHSRVGIVIILVSYFFSHIHKPKVSQSPHIPD